MRQRGDGSHWDRPCAAEGLISYRYKGCYGYILIGATSDEEALKQAARSTSNVDACNLEKWDEKLGVYK